MPTDARLIPAANFVVRTRRRVQLGPMSIEIRSNETRFSALRYFAGSSAVEPTDSIHYTLNFCNLNVDAPWPLEQIEASQDAHYRARRFSAGYYITDHFGTPAHLFVRKREYWVFGDDFELVLWPYFVKLLLTLYSLDRGLLHLKAAAVSVNGAGTLLIGRGGGGKTVMVARLCEAGAHFISNTHTLIDQQSLIGVPAAMRVRNDALFGPIIAARRLEANIKPGEYVLNPLTDLQWKSSATAPLRNICLADYRGPGVSEIREISPAVLFDYMDQFSLPLNVYGIKEDLLDHLGGNVNVFATHTSGMRNRLRMLTERCKAYHVSCDVNDARQLHRLRSLLGHY